MRSKLTAVAIALLAWAAIAPAQPIATNRFSSSPSLAVPDGDPDGLAQTISVTGLSGSIFDVTVTLNLTGGNNADLYAYLTKPNGGFAVLLNRVGVSSANPNGYENTGFSLTLSDAATANVHTYQAAAEFTLNAGSQLTGTWAPDGRNLDPQSASSLFDSTPSTATFSSFSATDPNGVWTLFIADLSGGGQSTLQSWEVSMTTVPEPGTTALVAVGGVLLFAGRRRRVRARSPQDCVGI